MLRDLLAKALECHRAGRLIESKLLYEQVLEIQPRHPDALHLSGVIALQGGDADRAIELIRQAVEVQPDNPGFHANLAQALLAIRRVAEAHSEFRRAVALDPRNPQFAVAAAGCLAMQGGLAQAEQELRAVAQRHPRYSLAWYNLGNAVQEQGRHEESLTLFRRAIELEPAHADAHNNLARSLHRLERFEEAEQAYRRCLALRPDYATGYCNLASVLMDRGRFVEAATLCREALKRCPGSAELHLKLGAAHTHLGELTSALEAFRAAAGAAPENPRAIWACGYTLVMTGNEREGLQWLERALALQTDPSEYRGAMATIYLALGDLRAGWREHEWRPARTSFLARNPGLRPLTKLPDGLVGARICLLREQGLGDELFFLRFAAALKSRGVRIAYRADARLVSMLERLRVFDQVLADQHPLPLGEPTLLAGDLPLALGEMDYPPPLQFSPQAHRLESMKERLTAVGAPPYLGLTWRGGVAPERQRGTDWVLHKAVPVAALSGALRGAAGTLIALQRNPERGELEQLAMLVGRPVHDFTALNDDLEGMLALLALLDDYIGISNTNVHLRAGTGRTARVLVPAPPEWRWRTSGEESPWFPGFRIYRQGIDGRWGDAVERLKSDLQGAPKRSEH